MKPTSVCNSSNNSDGTRTQMPLICSFHVFPTTLVEKPDSPIDRLYWNHEGNFSNTLCVTQSND